MKKVILFHLFLLLKTAEAQQFVNLKPENGDCSHPIQINDTVVVSEFSPVGFGNCLEINDNAKDDLYFFEQEHNTVWYWFKVKKNAILSFEIIPHNLNDDYDFSLYKFMDYNFCNDVKDKKILPVRTCISRNDKKIRSITGLNEKAKNKVIHSGEGNSFSQSIEVKVGEIYYLLVDNVYAQGDGHTIHLHWKWLPPPPQVFNSGDIIEFENIEFEPGTAQFARNAYGWLDSLLRIMKHHPKLKIEIQGHVDGYLSKNTEVYQRVSEERAMAVYNFLVKNQIDTTRMIYNGYGNTCMKYKRPDFQPELHKQNRRVAMVVLSNE